MNSYFLCLEKHYRNFFKWCVNCQFISYKKFFCTFFIWNNNIIFYFPKNSTNWKSKSKVTDILKKNYLVLLYRGVIVLSLLCHCQFNISLLLGHLLSTNIIILIQYHHVFTKKLKLIFSNTIFNTAATFSTTKLVQLRFYQFNSPRIIVFSNRIISVKC